MEIGIPECLEAALQDVGANPGALVIAGGTDVMVGVNFGRLRPQRLVALGRVPELRTMSLDEPVAMGAGVTFAQIAQTTAEPALRQAALTVGSPQVRNRATVGGNLGTCSPAGDALPVLAALDARIGVRSAKAARELTLEEFMLGPKRSALSPDELVVEVSWRPAGRSQSFLKIGPRHAMVIAVASVAVVIDRRRRRVGVALGSLAPTVVRVRAAETVLQQALEQSGWRALSLPRDAVAEAADLAASAARPIDDLRASAAYRRHLARVLTARAVGSACACT